MMAFCRYRTPPPMSRLLRLLAPDEKSSPCTGTLLRSDNGSQGNASTFGYLLSQIFPEDRNAFRICTTFHCNIHDRSHIVRPCIFHWFKTTISPTSLTAWMSEGNHETEGKISPREDFFFFFFPSNGLWTVLEDFLRLSCLVKASFLPLMGCKSQCWNKIKEGENKGWSSPPLTQE